MQGESIAKAEGLMGLLWSLWRRLSTSPSAYGSRRLAPLGTNGNVCIIVPQIEISWMETGPAQIQG